MPSVFADDRPNFERVSTGFADVDAALTTLGVADAPIEEQARKINAAWREPTLRPLLAPYQDVLKARGLLTP